MSTPSTDPLAPLAALPGVTEAVNEARRAVDRLYGHRVMRRRADEVTSEAALRGARASAALEGADWDLEEVRRRSDFGLDPQARLVGGALRLNAEAGQLLGAWKHSPLQVLARLHLLAVGEGDAVGRPRRAGEPAPDPLPGEAAAREKAEGTAWDAWAASPLAAGAAATVTAPVDADEAAARLDALAQLLAARGGTPKGPNTRNAPALVVAAVVHGELLTLRPFASGNGLVARAAQRVVLVAEGMDPKSICPAEVGLAELGSAAYRTALAGYASGTPTGMAAWIAHNAQALRLGARESTAVCEAMQRGMA